MTFGNMGLGLGLARQGGGGGGETGFWADYPAAVRVHDAREVETVTGAVDAQVTAWADFRGNYPAYETWIGTGITLKEHASGIRYIEGNGTSALKQMTGTADLVGARIVTLMRAHGNARTYFSPAAATAGLDGIQQTSNFIRLGIASELYGLNLFMATMPPRVPSGTWAVVDIELSELGYGRIWVDGVYAGVTDSPVAGGSFGAEVMFAGKDGATASNGAIAIAAVFPEGIGAQAETLADALSPLRDTLNGAAATLWTPDRLEGISTKSWMFDFTDTASMYTDAGVTNVSAPGDSVYRVVDQLDPTQYIEQATATAQAKYDDLPVDCTPAPGELAGVYFDGLTGADGDYYVSNFNTGIAGDVDSSFFAVFKPRNAFGDRYLLSTGSATALTRSVREFYIPGLFRNEIAGASSGADSAQVFVQYDNYMAYLDWGDSLYSIAVNSETPVEEATVGGVLSTDDSPIYFGRRIFDNAGFYQGAYFFAMGIDRKLTTLERHKLEGWAAHKYGLVSELPPGHPYIDAAPTV